MMNFALTTVLILASLGSAKALQCYYYPCKNGTVDPSCGKFGTPMLCYMNQVCAKYDAVDGKVYRGCRNLKNAQDNNQCFDYNNAELKRMCLCSTSLCNSALKNNVGFFLAFVAFLAAKFL
ncbi:uncharacterized protein LOC117110322 [Anneissia japonica]|uniref:uncharacterized protein LOC117110322 n=1 Tax=Anneissia japonica TaxID=1529436 RepID=UPI0014258C31|nr:uncharacterized protein LOC117110322 [Anneissia japonica]